MLHAFAVAILLHDRQVPEARLARIGSFHRQVSTDSEECQAWFDQGLAMLYGFQYNGAERCFSQAVQKDPQCAMAHWGKAIADGPFINAPGVSASASKEAIQELQIAKGARHCSPVERELIEAQQGRFSPDGPANRDLLNATYADAMRKVWQAHPDDPDVGALFGEALVDKRPWNQWSKEGTPYPDTLEAIATFRQVLKTSPLHPQALHMLIHSVEASSHPEEALNAADKLFNLQPDLGHMQHMPVHIYNRTGNWEKSVHASIVAIAQSRAYRKSRGGDSVGPTLDHYDHALAYAASMEGRSALALRALNLDDLSPEWLAKHGPDYDQELALPIKVMQRFGKWKQILDVPNFGPKMPVATAMLTGARAVAFAAMGRLQEARLEQAKFQSAYQAVPETLAWDDFDKARNLLDIELHVMNGEILIREQGQDEQAISEMRKAVEAEDALHYSEPPSWIQPTRHVLGAALLKLGRYSAAEAVFRDDIRKLRANGWSLYGLAKALEGQGRTREAHETMLKFQETWKYADIQINSPCLCLPSR